MSRSLLLIHFLVELLICLMRSMLILVGVNDSDSFPNEKKTVMIITEMFNYIQNKLKSDTLQCMIPLSQGVGCH